MLRLSNPLGDRELIITCDFGVSYFWGIHKGVDFRTKNEDYPSGVGTPIYMAHDGELVRVWESPSLEWCYHFKLKNGYELFYYHLSAINHINGWTKRKRGDLIGYSGGMPGKNRATTGPHLHFELRKDGKPVNPILGLEETNKFIERVENWRFIDVEDKGKFYIVYKGKKYYCKNGGEAFKVMQKMSTGITNEDIRMIPDGDINQL